ncbi:TrkH family potassium uptake protein [Vicingus serpentipes]|uniref:TrkH family potassium uptake protein n=1 Tax=Vicingus serpentipes TaxID=1926625 RepID=A0A5C6RTV3_9FLAO|nr:potassium transporter TrkG [Vicingus serpentipes]TXB65375.1 TrkH family potassium uptake protein [Vicingus serpentipes]
MPKSLINIKVIIHLVGSLVIICGALMALSIPFSIYYNEGDLIPLILSSAITLISGLVLKLSTKSHSNDEIKKREGYLIVALGWISMTIFGSLPYVLSNAIPNYSNAFFETISGLTTTGASILNDIEAVPKGVLFWRSMTQWIGGMGIIVLTIAILPLLGVGGMELFASEAPGPTKDKIHPRIKETAKRLWLIYFSLTLIQTILLMFPGGMNFYDAINHSLTTMSTGGFSTKQASVAHFDSAIVDYIIIVFMFIAGTNFTLLYFGAKLKLKKFWENDEFKWYIGTVIGLTFIIIPTVYGIVGANLGFEKSFRDVLFQVVSIITTTGFASADFTTWGAFVTFLFFLLLFTGASAGSTSGGMKLVRIVLLMKNGFLEFKRKLHPNAVIPVHLNGQGVPPHIIYNLLAFVFFYLSTFVVGSIIVTFLGVDFMEAVSAVATSVGNVGPGIASIGPSGNFYHLPDSSKWVLSILMLMGRLELFTIAILFTPYFWRRN